MRLVLEQASALTPAAAIIPEIKLRREQLVEGAPLLPEYSHRSELLCMVLQGRGGVIA